MKFSKKPIVIEAMRVADAVNAARSDWKALPDWLVAHYEQGNVLFLPDGVSISTLEGRMKAGLPDWIIRGIKGEIYPCKPDIFSATYDPFPENGMISTVSIVDKAAIPPTPDRSAEPNTPEAK